MSTECSHAVLYRGLCVECGADQTEAVRLERAKNKPDTAVYIADRDTIKHEVVFRANLAVENAKAAAKQLIDSRKLFLVLDLDHTLIHATCDATFLKAAESWTWQSSERQRALPDLAVEQCTVDADLFRFKLDSVQFLVKLRPGVHQMLKQLSALYDMHVYTAGTQPYADAIRALIDPDKIYFGDRVFSRDDFGNERNQKDLAWLFPCDRSMVMIVDDRADVWSSHKTNLFHIRPFDYFKGSKEVNPVAPQDEEELDSRTLYHHIHRQHNRPNVHHGSSTPGTPQAGASRSPARSPSADRVSPSGGAGGASASAADVAADGADPTPVASSSSPQRSASASRVTAASAVAASPGVARSPERSVVETPSAALPAPTTPLSTRDDLLMRVCVPVLVEVHRRFYTAATVTVDMHVRAEDILTSLRKNVLRGCNIVFSGVFPATVNVMSQLLAIEATRFGAKVAPEIDATVTHVVAARAGTAKVRQAQKMGIPCVKTRWLQESIARWSKQVEQSFLLEPQIIAPRSQYIDTSDSDTSSVATQYSEYSQVVGAGAVGALRRPSLAAGTTLEFGNERAGGVRKARSGSGASAGAGTGSSRKRRAALRRQRDGDGNRGGDNDDEDDGDDDDDDEGAGESGDESSSESSDAPSDPEGGSDSDLFGTERARHARGNRKRTHRGRTPNSTEQLLNVPVLLIRRTDSQNFAKAWVSKADAADAGGEAAANVSAAGTGVGGDAVPSSSRKRTHRDANGDAGATVTSVAQADRGADSTTTSSSDSDDSSDFEFMRDLGVLDDDDDDDDSSDEKADATQDDHTGESSALDSLLDDVSDG